MMRLCYQRVDADIVELVTTRIADAVAEHDRLCRSGSHERCDAADQLRTALFANHNLILNSLRDLLDVRRQFA